MYGILDVTFMHLLHSTGSLSVLLMHIMHFMLFFYKIYTDHES